MKVETAKNIALYGVCAAVAAGGIWLGLRFALPVLLPFFIAYALSCAICPAALYLEGKTSVKGSIWSVIIILLLISAVAAFFWFCAGALLRETRDAISGLADIITRPDGIVPRITEFVRGLGERFGGGEELTRALSGLMNSAAEAASSVLTGMAGKLLAGLPSFAFALVMSLISLFYFTVGHNAACGAVVRLLPESRRGDVLDCVSAAMRGLGRFIRMYLCIMAVTFAELFAGFAVLGVEHALLWAMIIAVIDVLPVLGVGTVLVPWAAAALIGGESFRGLGLLVLLCIMWGVRQPLEARLTGKSAGVHPILALISVYAGFRLAGVGGMILAPLVLNAWAVMWEERGKKLKKTSRS